MKINGGRGGVMAIQTGADFAIFMCLGVLVGCLILDIARGISEGRKAREVAKREQDVRDRLTAELLTSTDIPPILLSYDVKHITYALVQYGTNVTEEMLLLPGVMPKIVEHYAGTSHCRVLNWTLMKTPGAGPAIAVYYEPAELAEEGR